MPKLPPLTRRNFVALSAGSAAAATLGPWTKVYAAPPNNTTFLDESPTVFMARIANLRAQGMRPLSVAVYGPANAPQVIGTFIQRTGPAWEITVNVPQADLDAFMLACWFAGYRVTHLAATGTAAAPRFAAIAEATTIGTAPLRYLTSGADTNSGTIQYWLRIARETSMIPSALAIYGTSVDPRYVLALESNPDPERIRWNAEGLNETLLPFRARATAHAEQRARPALVQISPGLMYMSLFRGDEFPSYPTLETDLTSTQLITTIGTHRLANRYPVQITANSSGAVNRFAAIFTGSEQIVPRQIIRSGPNRSAEIDQIMIDAMAANRVRHASLAIVNKHRRLVYARAFKLAEAGYKEVSPTSHFRLASISKTLTSMLTLEIIQNGGAAFPLQLNTPIQSVLNLRKPDGGVPVANWDKITVEHILRHASGMGNIVRPEVVAAAFGGASMPITKGQMARWACAQPLAFTPGDPPPPRRGDPWSTSPLYSNLAFVVLSHLIETITLSTLHGALRNRILTPLGATRVRVAPAHLASHPADEAAYDAPQHDAAWGLSVGPSVITAARPTVPFVYGADLDYRCVDAGSGLSASAPDLAKILASLGGAAGGVLNQANRDRMLLPGKSLATPPPLQMSETRIGFDSSGGGALRSGEKGGWFLGTNTTCRYVEGGWSYVLLFNSSKVPGNYVNALNTLLARVAPPALDDALSCLFNPSFGIPAF